MDEPLAAIAARLGDRLGLDPDALGHRALARVVRHRARVCAVADGAAYLALLDASPAEWQALVESVVVPETWFFRDQAPFALLGRWAAERRRGGEPAITALSLPCATGEEAWSIAIALAAAGVEPAAVRIEARDVSERALAIARAAVYGPRALRGRSPRPAWARYLIHRSDGGWEVAPILRPTVHFATGNLLDAARRFAARQFDCIFARNLLIYCTPEARARALETFAALLRPDGLLVLGHAETLPARTPDFIRARPLEAFAWRRVATAPASHAHRAPVQMPAPRPPISVPAPAPDRLPAAQGERAGATVSAARALADAGRLAEAATVAEAAVIRRPADASAHALLGVIRAAQGRDAEALEALRRALYLDPDHEEARVHLAVIRDRRGDTAAAARLRSRAGRSGASR